MAAVDPLRRINFTGEGMRHSLRDLLLGHEDWLIYRVIDYAKANDYSQYTPTLVSAWRESVVGLRDELARALDEHPGLLPMPADHDYCADPYTTFAIGSARRHRARGVTLALFLGLTKFFRLTFLDLVDKEHWPEPEARRARELIARYFDRIELAISIDWASLGENEKIAEVQDKNRALANEKDKYLTIFESLEDPVFVLDERNGIENMNGAAWRLFGVENDPGELYYRPEGASVALKAVTSRLDPSSLIDGASLALQTSTGESFFDVRRRDILDICDKYAGSVVILNDVTTHKHALRAAEEANRAKSAFLSTMTHELRTPLNGVLGAMRLIRDEGLTDAQNEFADTIERSGERLLGVINNVLDYSRIEAGRIEVARAPFVLPEMLDGVLAIVRPRAIESGVHLTLDCMAPHDAHRLGDAGKIQQVLLNLVGNAMKFSPRGRVTVNVRRAHGRDGRLRFEVVDDGTGVDEAALPRLFEPFTQIHPHTTDRGQGAGLGLAISRALVTGMGGEIGAERRRERGQPFLVRARSAARRGAGALRGGAASGHRQAISAHHPDGGGRRGEPRRRQGTARTPGPSGARRRHRHGRDPDGARPSGRRRADGYPSAGHRRLRGRKTHPDPVRGNVATQPTADHRSDRAGRAIGCDRLRSRRDRRPRRQALLAGRLVPPDRIAARGRGLRSPPPLPPARTRGIGSIRAYSPITSAPSAPGVPHGY